VRELRNLVERIVILAPPEATVLDEAEVRDLIPHRNRSLNPGPTPELRSGAKLSELVEDAERAIVLQAMEAHQGVIADAARALGVERSNFHKKLKQLGIK
jgi:two-component system nitrogen regulation response regulator NtrX